MRKIAGFEVQPEVVSPANNKTTRSLSQTVLWPLSPKRMSDIRGQRSEVAGQVSESNGRMKVRSYLVKHFVCS